MSTLCFGIANIVLIIFCPKIIKDHLSYAGFRGDGKGEGHLEEYSSDIGMMYEYYYEIKLKEEGTIANLPPTQALQKLSKIQPEEIYIQENFWAIYNTANLYHQSWRRTCVIFYALGVVLFGWVLILNIIWVVSVVL